MIKHSDHSNLREKAFILAHSARFGAHHVGEGVWGSWSLCTHSQEEEQCCAPLVFPFSHSSGFLLIKRSYQLLAFVFPPQWNWINTDAHNHAGGCTLPKRCAQSPANQAVPDLIMLSTQPSQHLTITFQDRQRKRKRQKQRQKRVIGMTLFPFSVEQYRVKHYY